MTKKKIIAIIQARFNSSRFPGKVLKKIGNKTILEILLNRIKKSKKIDQIIVATTNNKNDDKISNLSKKLKFECYRGSEKNVLDRFYKCSKKYNATDIIRITADCPLLEYKFIDEMVDFYLTHNVDYACNNNPPTYPDGLDLEIISFQTLKKAHLNARSLYDQEHVTTYIKNDNNLKKINIKNRLDYSNIRITIDEFEDFELIKKIFSKFGKKIFFSINDVINLYKNDKSLFKTNSHIQRNQGSIMNTGQKYFKRAKRIIPGGTMLFSKNPDLFLPEFWPAYYKKSKGINIWDLDNRKFIDLSLMGVGTNLLGYSNNFIDREINKVIKNGNMTTLNSYEEIELAEKLVEMHPWSEMVKFCRSGAEASSIAIRLARASTLKNKIAICGYHGWQDWYLSANFKKGSLDSHLMKNITTDGINKNLSNSTVSFDYNNLKQFKSLISKNKSQLAAVIMEVERNEKPKKNFLQEVRKLTQKYNIKLIFDECSSGFRETYGGLHLKYKVYPDIALFGKTLGNGYAINAVVGKKDVMKCYKKTFISSTFWSERIGSVAALQTIKFMKKYKTWNKVIRTGTYIKQKWKLIAKKNKIKIKIYGLNSMPKFDFNDDNHMIYKTFLTQEFLKKGYLASNSIYVSTLHTKKILKKYFTNLDIFFSKIRKNIILKKSPHDLLDGKVAISGLRDSNVK